MKAVRIHKFGGGPQDLVYEEDVMPPPPPKEGDNNIINLTTLVALFLFYFSEIISEISGLLINPILRVCFFVVNMFPLVKSMVYLFLMLFFHVV
jgi:hypothetical protein